MAQEHKRRRTLAPEVAEADVLAEVVPEHHVLERPRVRRRVGVLLGANGV
jgi:hypothetical protein